MSVDIFSTHVLTRVVENLVRPSSFLLDTFFMSEQTEESEEIHFDIDKSKPRLTPFVSPLVAGQVVDDEGYMTKSFKPAYAKDKRRFDPTRPLKRFLIFGFTMIVMLMSRIKLKNCFLITQS